MIEERILNRLARRLDAALAAPPVPLTRFIVDGTPVGELTPARARRLLDFTDVFVMSEGALTFVPVLDAPGARSAAMDRVARELAAEGALTAWRDERYDVAIGFAKPPVFLLERAAARYFGVATHAVHVNGTAALGDGREGMWLGRRSTAKAIDPGRLDNMVGGGVAAGADIRATLVKEAWEEAGLPPGLAARAVPTGEVRIRRLQPDGVQRESIHVHDLALPGDVVPANRDGEVVAFRLCPVDEVAVIAANEDGPDVVTADASLVIADWLLRHGHVPAGSAAERALGALRFPGT